MNKTLIVIVSFATALILISSVCAVPNVGQQNETLKLPTIPARLLNRLIDKVGDDVYNNITYNIRKLFYTTAGITPGEPSIYIDAFVSLAVFVILFTLAVFGHSEGAYSIATALSALALVIPCFGSALIVALPVAVSCIFIMLDIVPLNFIYDWGVFGFIVFLLLVLPVALILACAVYPVVVLDCGLGLLIGCLTEAFNAIK